MYLLNVLSVVCCVCSIEIIFSIQFSLIHLHERNSIEFTISHNSYHPHDYTLGIFSFAILKRLNTHTICYITTYEPRDLTHMFQLYILKLFMAFYMKEKEIINKLCRYTYLCFGGMSTALKFYCSVCIGRMGTRMLERYPNVTWRSSLDASYSLMCGA